MSGWRPGRTSRSTRSTGSGLSEQRLLTVTAGAVFHDDDGRLTAVRAKLAAFPPTCGSTSSPASGGGSPRSRRSSAAPGLGDELGSRLIAARLARDAMRMAFLIEGRYAPYPKWFGTAFAELPCAAATAPLLDRALAPATGKLARRRWPRPIWRLARLHKARGLPGAFEPLVGPFHERPFTVINAEEICAALSRRDRRSGAARAAVIGSLDQVTDSTPVIEAPARARRAMRGAIR